MHWLGALTFSHVGDGATVVVLATVDGGKVVGGVVVGATVVGAAVVGGAVVDAAASAVPAGASGVGGAEEAGDGSVQAGLTPHKANPDPATFLTLPAQHRMPVVRRAPAGSTACR